jgi:hypothetical protein
MTRKAALTGNEAPLLPVSTPSTMRVL